MADQKVSEVMSTNPLTVPATENVTAVARQMRDADVGDVLVRDDGHLLGIVTDRDITIRVVADGKNPDSTPVREACSAGDLATVSPNTSIKDAVKLMREKAVRRLPVVEGDRPVGIISIGDLAMERDQGSALADISAAPGNE